MSERERNKAKALEYARSQNWRPPEECEGIVRNEAEAGQDAMRIAELQARLDAETESHAVTRNTVLRQRDRIQALEGEIAARDQAIAGLRKRRAKPEGQTS